MEQAFSWLRSHARTHNLLLVDVAVRHRRDGGARSRPDPDAPPLNHTGAPAPPGVTRRPQRRRDGDLVGNWYPARSRLTPAWGLGSGRVQGDSR
jgi:hypothetical protein